VDIPTVTTERLVLRPFQPRDVPDLHAILQSPGILRYFREPGPPALDWVERLIARKLAFWEERGMGWWAVVPRSGGPLIGWAGLASPPNTDETEVGYLLAKPFWGRGFATEAARASLEWGFAEHPVDRIIGITHPENVPSQKVLLRLGMEYEGMHRYYEMDVRRYGISRARFEDEAGKEHRGG
jgi:ribosomal-protein-alanine N-acetyltransferase